jgi:hypothetical protein
MDWDGRILMKTELEKEVRFFKVYAVVAALLGAVFVLTAFTLQSGKQNFEEITAKRINMLDSTGKIRVILAGEFPKPRADYAGLIFNNGDGYEAGGLVYSGTRDKDGRIDEGAVLTFDQYRSDQIVALDYDHHGDQKRQGLVIADRPDTMNPLVREFYQALNSAKSSAEAESIKKDYLSRIPARDFVARRLFAGRDKEGSSLVTLSDPDGKPRLRLEVDKLGQARITFLDPSGKVVRTIKP